MPSKNRLKMIGVDILGVLLIIAAGLTGWLPGPGGIPLLIIGLSLLATNHEWAERWLDKVKSRGGKLTDKLFNGSRKTRWAIDIITVVLIAAAVYILVYFTKSLIRSAAISLIIFGIFLFFGNRNRFHSIKQKLKKT